MNSKNADMEITVNLQSRWSCPLCLDLIDVLCCPLFFLPAIQPPESQEVIILTEDDTVQVKLSGYSAADVQWRINGSSLEELGMDRYEVQPDGSLLIRDVKFSDAGRYTVYESSSKLEADQPSEFILVTVQGICSECRRLFLVYFSAHSEIIYGRKARCTGNFLIIFPLICGTFGEEKIWLSFLARSAVTNSLVLKKVE